MMPVGASLSHHRDFPVFLLRCTYPTGAQNPGLRWSVKTLLKRLVAVSASRDTSMNVDGLMP